MNNAAITVSNREIPLKEQSIRGKYRMLVPADFYEDQNQPGNYTFLYSKEDSPLGLAVKYVPAVVADRQKQISVYFNQAPETLETIEGACGDILYRAVTTNSQYQSVYTLRFAANVADGLLLGCFNCAAEDGPSWHEGVLHLLRSIASA